MLVLTKSQTAEVMTLTLNEKRTLANGYYLFVFTNVTTKSVVNKIFSFAEDDSNYQDRYNLFTINTNNVFANQDDGDWRYNIYEQASSSNTDTTGLTEVESGLLKLNPAADFEFEVYEPATTFKEYGG